MAAKQLSHNRQYGSIAEFYTSIINKINNPYHDHLKNKDNANWYGLNNQDIEKAKNGYTDGMEIFNQLPDPELFGGSKLQYKYNETDGDDLNVDRFLDGLPAMHKRTRVNGNNTGQFKDIYINLAEDYTISFNKMLYKTFAAAKIIDAFEAQNIRVAVYVVCSCNLELKGKSKRIPDTVTIKIKDYNESVIIPIMLNAISPWFFRKHILTEITGKFKTVDSIGSPEEIPDKNPENIYIETGQCLSFDSAKQFINNLNLN
jgi:hypothetical protein